MIDRIIEFSGRNRFVVFLIVAVATMAGLYSMRSIPVDAIPDFIPVFGMLDDIAVLAWLMKTLDDEHAAFRLWRNRQQPEKLAVVERLPDTPEQLQLQGPKKT